MKIRTLPLVFVCIIFVCATSSWAQIYFTKSVGTTRGLARVDLDGSNGVQLVSTSSQTRGLALDLSGGHIYWTDRGLDQVNRANLDGSSQTTLISSLDTQAIALDLTNSRMYLTEAQVSGSDIVRANLDGSSVVTILAKPLSEDSDGIALDVANQHIYYTVQTTQELRRVNFNGTGDVQLHAGSVDFWAIALDLGGGKVYWTEGTDVAPGTGTGAIRRANLDGSSVETILSGLEFVDGLALDATNSNVYYAVNDPTTPANSYIGRVNFDGTDNTTLITGGMAEGVREIAVVIPEPSTYALIFAALTLVFAFLKRQKAVA